MIIITSFLNPFLSLNGSHDFELLSGYGGMVPSPLFSWKRKKYFPLNKINGIMVGLITYGRVNNFFVTIFAINAFLPGVSVALD